MNILEDAFWTIKKMFLGNQDCNCGYISIIRARLEGLGDDIYYFMRRKYYRHICHSYFRTLKNYWESTVDSVIELWPTAFIFLSALFLSVMVIKKHIHRKQPKQFERNNFKNSECYVLEAFEEHCNNNFPSVTDSDENQNISYRASNHSLLNKTFTNIERNKRQNSHSSVNSSQEFDDVDVLNVSIPVHRMRRESVCAETYDPEKVITPYRFESHFKNDTQKKFLLESVKNTFPFNLLDGDQLELVLDAMFQRRVSKGEVIICEGDDGDFFYVVERGSYVVSVSRNNEQKVLKVYHEKGSFGELALLYNTRRAATVSAAVDGIVWCLDRLTFKSVVAQTAHQRRVMNESLLRRLPLLSHLPTDDILSLSDALVRRLFSDGELIIQEGDVPNGMYFIRKGTVRVCVLNGFQEEKELGTLTVGDYFGERALITRGRREASVYANGFAELEFLELDAFERLLGPCVDLFKERIAMQNQGMIITSEGQKN